MDILTWTTYDDVRALLGISSSDISDATLALPVYATALEAELRQFDSTLIAQYTRVYTSPAPTEDEAWFNQLARQFAAYVVALQAASSVPMAAIRDEADGRASQSRFQNDPYKEVQEALQAQMTKIRDYLRTALATLNVTPATVTIKIPAFLSISSPTFDPVTGV